MNTSAVKWTVEPTVEPVEPTVTTGSFLEQYATTPKRGAARKTKKEPAALLAHAIEYGNRVDVTDEATITALNERGLKTHRIANAASDLKKYYGVSVTTERNGRKVIAYTITV